MRRALAILKYVPAVLCGLLVVAWVVSLNLYVEVAREFGNGRIIVGIEDGSAVFRLSRTVPNTATLFSQRTDWRFSRPLNRYFVGSFDVRERVNGNERVVA